MDGSSCEALSRTTGSSRRENRAQRGKGHGTVPRAKGHPVQGMKRAAPGQPLESFLKKETADQPTSSQRETGLGSNGTERVSAALQRQAPRLKCLRENDFHLQFQTKTVRRMRTFSATHHLKLLPSVHLLLRKFPEYELYQNQEYAEKEEDMDPRQWS